MNSELFLKFIILLNLNLYLIIIIFVGYYKTISFADKVYQRSDIDGQDLHGLHKMTTLLGGRCCCSFSF